MVTIGVSKCPKGEDVMTEKRIYNLYQGQKGKHVHNIESPLEAWPHLFEEAIMDAILIQTNTEIMQQHKFVNSYFDPISLSMWSNKIVWMSLMN